MLDVVIRVTHAPFEAPELERAQLVSAGALDRFQVSGGRGSDWHRLLRN
jgi:hypothetical protein